MSNFQAKWFEGVKDPREREEILETLNNAFLRENFLNILTRMEAELDRLETTLTAYDSPSWAYRQAHINGSREVYSKIRQLFKESKTNG